MPQCSISILIVKK